MEQNFSGALIHCRAQKFSQVKFCGKKSSDIHQMQNELVSFNSCAAVSYGCTQSLMAQTSPTSGSRLVHKDSGRKNRGGPGDMHV